MSHVEQQTIVPVAQTTSIAIPLQELQKFNDVFWSKSVYDFHVNDKKVDGEFIIFQIRSMRVNEFLDILDDNKISWSHINYK